MEHVPGDTEIWSERLPDEAVVMLAPAVAVGRSTYHDSVHVDSYAEQTREEVAERACIGMRKPVVRPVGRRGPGIG